MERRHRLGHPCGYARISESETVGARDYNLSQCERKLSSRERAAYDASFSTTGNGGRVAEGRIHLPDPEPLWKNAIADPSSGFCLPETISFLSARFKLDKKR